MFKIKAGSAEGDQMRYYINGRFLTQRITGVQRYAREMTLALDRLLQEKRLCEDEYVILIPPDFHENLECQCIKTRVCGRLSGHLWEQIELPYFAKDGFLINFCNCAPLIKKNQTVTIHDAAIAAFPNAYSWKFRIWYKIMYTVLGKRLGTIFTVSNFSRDELHKYFNIDKEKIHITYNGVEHLQAIYPDNRILDKVPKNYVLAVSSQNPTKNFKLIIEAARQMSKVQFVIAGGMNTKVFNEKMKSTLSNVHYVGYVSDEELVSLYHNARVFVYPSLYEGFGIPPLEAMLNGSRVIVSKEASLPEICGKYAIYCDAYNCNDLIKKIQDCIDCINVSSNKMVAKIKEKYSWLKSGKCYKVYTYRIKYSHVSCLIILIAYIKKVYRFIVEGWIMKVLFLTNIPSPYRVKFFLRLGKLCDLTVLYEIKRASNRDKNWISDKATSYHEVYMHTYQLIDDGGITFDFFHYLKRNKYDFIIIGTHGTPTSKLAMFYMRLFQIPYILNIDGMISAEIQEKSSLNRILRSVLFKGASAYITSGQDTIKYLKFLGINSSDMYIYHFTSVVEADILNKSISYEEKASLRRELGIQEKSVFLSVARFIPEKGLDMLINAFKEISNRDTALVLIGGDKSVYKNLLETLPRDIRNRVYFPGFMNKKHLYQYYKAANCFVLPTHHDAWGLVINEALSCGLPIITTNRCGAGLEMIKNGENGILVNHTDKNALKAAMIELLDNPKECAMMGIRNLELAHDYTIENMVNDHMHIFQQILGSNY